MLNEFHHSTKWISEGKIKWKEIIDKGLENAPKVVIGLFERENFGKMLIKMGLEV
jgi:NADPH-dependent curcumin reductase CurA